MRNPILFIIGNQLVVFFFVFCSFVFPGYIQETDKPKKNLTKVERNKR